MAHLQSWLLCMVVLLGRGTCVRAGACSTDNDCKNGGTCDISDCTCLDGYSGYNCENVCSTNNDCNGGTCEDGTEGKVCNCPATKYGQQCENDQVCASNNDCQNGGTCNKTTAVYACACAQGFSGSTCRDACTNNGECNGGTCTAVSPKTCTCHTSKYGVRCENAQTCSMDDDCLNGGTCNTDNESNVCNCKGDYTGTTCQDACDADEDCNGGTCTTQSPRTCSCQSGKSGDQCQNASTKQQLSKGLLSLFILSLICSGPVSPW